METSGLVINCLIVDDEPPAQRVLENYINDIPFLALAAKCKNVFEASAIMQSKNIDLLFLDINMPKMSGLDFLRTLKKPPLVIITTAYREFALEGFELDVTDYLNKPFSFERFFTAVNKVAGRLQTKTLDVTEPTNIESKKIIFVREDKITYKVVVDEILYLESVGDYVKIHTPAKTYLIYQTLRNFENVLLAPVFYRVHRSFIIPIDKIDSIEGNMIKIGKQIIPIGATYRKVFFDGLDNYQKI